MPAVADLLPAHLPQLQTFVKRRLGHRLRIQESSSDLVQSVCREVLESRADVTFQNAAQFQQWLFTVALAKLVDRHRRISARKRSPAGALLPSEMALDDEPTPSEVAAHAEQCHHVEELIRGLPSDQREVIVLARLCELPHAEVSKIMNRSEVATRKLLSRAMASLGALLARRVD
jgi:RNA polymerase sigma factor (sigma-70 family)